jgi:hypothetical protein
MHPSFNGNSIRYVTTDIAKESESGRERENMFSGVF